MNKNQFFAIFFIVALISVSISHQNCARSGGSDPAAGPTTPEPVPSNGPTTNSTSTVSLQIKGDGAGKVTGDGFDCKNPSTGTCTKTAAVGSSVTLTATPDSGSKFTSWQGYSGCGTATVCKVTFGSSTTAITANFAKDSSSSSGAPVLGAAGVGNYDGHTIWVLGQKFSNQTKAHLRATENGNVIFEVLPEKIIFNSSTSLQFDVKGLGDASLLDRLHKNGGLWVTLVNPGDNNFAWPPLLVRPPTYEFDGDGKARVGTGGDGCAIWVIGYQLENVSAELRKISTAATAPADGSVPASAINFTLSTNPQSLTLAIPSGLKSFLKTQGLQLRLSNPSAQTSTDALVDPSPSCN